MKILSLVSLSVVTFLLGCSSTPSTPAADTAGPKLPTLEEVIAGAHRSEANKARDQYRHPAETLKFFGLEPSMTVVEIAPGEGWYTEILAPYLAGRGKLILAGGNANSANEYPRKGAAKLKEKATANEANWGKVEINAFEPPDVVNIAPAGSADMVVTFRNVHNWMGAGPKGAPAAFAAFYAALKPGGILGIEEHREKANHKQDPKAESGYVTEATVQKFAKDAGFIFLEKSEINANPKDKAKHPKGVWTLPPVLKLGDKDKSKYLGIGESDRMTMKFQKPVSVQKP